MALSLLAVSAHMIIFYLQHQLVASQLNGFESLKAVLTEGEFNVLTKIAKGDKIGRDDVEEGALQGVLDEGAYDDVADIVEEEEEGFNEDNDFIDEDHGHGDYIIESMLVQKLHKADEVAKKPPFTTYHTFEDTTFMTPLFTRSVEDYRADFIIYANPSFPLGTGHFVVLRRLAAPNDMANYEMEDEFDAEDEDEYENEIADDDYDYERRAGELSSDESYDPMTTLPPGIFQSGEENFPDNEEITNPAGQGASSGDAVGIENKGGYEEDDAVKPRLPFRLKILVRATSPPPRPINNDDPTGETEVVYEAFSINFKESLHGFISDIDPLQYSFLNNDEDALAALMDEDVDNDNPVGEGEDDSDSEEDLENVESLTNEEMNAIKLEGANGVALTSDMDYMDFQNSVRYDAGMRNVDANFGDGSENSGNWTGRGNVAGTGLKRRKRAITLRLTRAKKNSDVIQWKGCLQSFNINTLVFEKNKTKMTEI